MTQVKCEKCENSLAQTDGTNLYFEIKGFESEITIKKMPLPCDKCKHITVWEADSK